MLNGKINLSKDSSRNVNEPKKRVLRSNKSSENTTNLSLFNFENVNTLIFKQEPITVSSGKSYEDLYKSGNDVEVPEVSKIAKCINLKIVDNILPRRSKHFEDPLPDSIYEAFHNRLRKEEKSMVNTERSRMLTEVDNLKSLLMLLDLYDWEKYLPMITVVRNSRDINELESKKELTIAEIKKLLQKYADWKKRHEKLTNEMRAFEKKEPNDTEDQDYGMSLEDLRSKRLLERRKEVGPRIKLNLNNGYTLLIDPLVAPKIILTNQVDSSSKINSPLGKEQNRFAAVKENVLSRKRKGHYIRSGKGQKFNIIKAEGIKNKEKLDLKFDLEKGIAFGKHLPDLGHSYTDFEIDRRWRHQANKWLDERKKLRRKLKEG
ncbi:uncharacterized protein PRCAT00000794001 [Priceomyces carsonii]|uniref:uncharacterized protein n=1 Tax=Priceomyces carsonii TaxID=28549 RepID=UPI002ED8B273|nr:unnamed protein product [Priceomyces carsonii]